MRGFVFFLGSPAEGGDPAETCRQIIQEAQHAEALGFYGAFVAEHHFTPITPRSATL